MDLEAHESWGNECRAAGGETHTVETGGTPDVHGEGIVLKHRNSLTERAYALPSYALIYIYITLVF